jgi:hypothetical protein
MAIGKVTYYVERATGQIIPASALPTRQARARTTKQYFYIGRLSGNQKPYRIFKDVIVREFHAKVIVQQEETAAFARWLSSPEEYPDVNSLNPVLSWRKKREE